MNVRELIECLERFDPNLRVEVGYTNECADEGRQFLQDEINRIERVRQHVVIYRED